MSDNLQIVRDRYADFVTGNIPGVLDRFAEEFTFTVPGVPEVPYAGTRRSREEAPLPPHSMFSPPRTSSGRRRRSGRASGAAAARP